MMIPNYSWLKSNRGRVFVLVGKFGRDLGNGWEPTDAHILEYGKIEPVILPWPEFIEMIENKQLNVIK